MFTWQGDEAPNPPSRDHVPKNIWWWTRLRAVIWSVSSHICSAELWPRRLSYCLGEKTSHEYSCSELNRKLMMPRVPLWFVGTNDAAEPICSRRSAMHQSDATGASLTAAETVWGQLNSEHLSLCTKQHQYQRCCLCLSLNRAVRWKSELQSLLKRSVTGILVWRRLIWLWLFFLKEV